ncbi:MAG: FixH family protein [Gemmatimonadaceae bacterium]|nr:FixH family protein [Gemmatimonadaceae bacterium]MCW5827266.1 FixH family protein [Gemmatimonadaceae bacterium]
MKRGWQWPVLVTLALAFTVGVNVVMLFASSRDPNGTVVEPDYYRKAVEWDRTMARRAASAALGWSAEASLGASAEAGRELRVTLADRDGVPIADADVHVTLIHNREASTPLQVQLAALGAGAYSAPAVAARGGLWEVRITARRGSERFEDTQHTEAP